MGYKWLARDQQPQQLSPASQEALRAMREVYDICPAEEKKLVRDAFNEYCQGSTQELGPRGSERPDDFGAEDEAYMVRAVKQIAHDAGMKVRKLASDYRKPVKVPTFDETYPDAGRIRQQY